MSHPDGSPSPSPDAPHTHVLAWTRVGAHLRGRMLVPVVVVGLLGGAVGAAYLAALHGVESVLGPDGHTAPIQLVLLVGVGIAVAVLTRVLGDSGNVELLVDNIHVRGGDADPRPLVPLIPTSLLCVGVGGTLGPEAPLVQACGTVGSWWADRWGRSVVDTRILTITGMAAGFSVLFGAPLGAALFALEILHSKGLQYYEAIVPALIGALAGLLVLVAVSHVGLEPMWTIPAPGALDGRDMAWGAACGVLGALGALAFTAAVTWSRRATTWVHPVLLPVVGGLLLGLLQLWSPFALTNGELQVGEVLSGSLTVSALAVVLVAKFAGTVVALVSRWKGGFIIPMFFLGIAGGQLLHQLVPSTNLTVVTVALAVSLCVGVTKTPLGSTLVVTQMAGLPLLPMSLAAAVISLVITSPATVIDSQRDRSTGEEG